MRTIASKLNRIYLIVAFSALFGVGAISQASLYLHSRAAAQEALGNWAVALAPSLQPALAVGDAHVAQQTLNTLQGYSEVRMAVVILPDGKYLAKYQRQGDQGDDNALGQNPAQGNFINAGEIGVTQPITLQGTGPARLVLVASLEKLNRESLQILGASTAIWALILLASYMLFRRMSRTVTRPIEELTATIRTVECEGDLGHRTKILSDDEIGELAKGFNSLLNILEMHNIRLNAELQEHRTKEADQRIAWVASEEAMFITDAASVILRINRAFSDITGYAAEEAVGQTPRLLNSGCHDAAYFAEMHESLKHKGTWQGEILNRRKSGDVFPAFLKITAVKNTQGQLTHYVSTFTDTTSGKTVDDEIRYQTVYDPLTRLPNRALLLDRMKKALASATRGDRYGALLFIDLDNFKYFNDTLGYDYGDLLLKRVAQRLVSCVREGDTVSRLGGDEYVVMLDNLGDSRQESATQAKLVGEKLLAVLSQPYRLYSSTHHSTSSIGIALFTNNDDTVDDLLKRADLAMYQAKTTGRNTVCLFDPKILDTARTAHDVTSRIHAAG